MRRPLRTLLVVGALGVGLLAAALWWFVIRDDSPPEAALPDRTTSSTAGEGEDGGIAGTWALTPDDESFVGFRISEQLPGLDNTAVVRTAAVEGTLAIEGTEVTAATITADLTALESKDAQPPGVPGIENRVDQMRGDGLETDTFPTAEFTLTEPLDLGGAPEVDQVVEVTAVGELTLHGETRAVEIPLEARWNGAVIDVAGSLEVALADFGMTPPERAFVSVADSGTLELQLTFARS